MSLYNTEYLIDVGPVKAFRFPGQPVGKNPQPIVVVEGNRSELMPRLTSCITVDVIDKVHFIEIFRDQPAVTEDLEGDEINNHPFVRRFFYHITGDPIPGESNYLRDLKSLSPLYSLLETGRYLLTGVRDTPPEALKDIAWVIVHPRMSWQLEFDRFMAEQGYTEDQWQRGLSLRQIADILGKNE